MQLIRHTLYQRAWEILCDKTPANEEAQFNVRFILDAAGIPQGSADRIIKQFETQEGHKIKRVPNTGKGFQSQPLWQWDFGSDSE